MTRPGDLPHRRPVGIKRRALVVDGDPVARLAIDRQLDAIGWEAYAANNGSEAIRMLDVGPRFDAVLTALRLPDIDGRDVATAARGKLPDAPIILLTQQPVRVLGFPFLVKPFSTPALAAALAQ